MRCRPLAISSIVAHAVAHNAMRAGSRSSRRALARRQAAVLDARADALLLVMEARVVEVGALPVVALVVDALALDVLCAIQPLLLRGGQRSVRREAVVHVLDVLLAALEAARL